MSKYSRISACTPSARAQTHSPTDAPRPPGTAVALGGRLWPFLGLLLLPPVPVWGTGKVNTISKQERGGQSTKTAVESRFTDWPRSTTAAASVPGVGPPPPRTLGPPPAPWVGPSPGPALWTSVRIKKLKKVSGMKNIQLMFLSPQFCSRLISRVQRENLSRKSLHLCLEREVDRRRRDRERERECFLLSSFLSARQQHKVQYLSMSSPPSQY